MTLSREQQLEMSRFPESLRALVEAEIAAGNSVTEVGHSFPAPPAGAYFKLANKVNTRTRSSGDGLDFYERNSSIYTDEFTDAKRFYFVLEPPNPPPPELDMDLIRKSYEPHSDPLAESTQTRENSCGATLAAEPSRNTDPVSAQTIESTFANILPTEESDIGLTRILHFRDERPLHEIQIVLERRLMALFTPKMENGKLCLGATATVVGVRYDFLLRFEAALQQNNCYSLRVVTTWGEVTTQNCGYYRKTSASWSNLWTGDLKAADPPLDDQGSLERYSQLCDDAMAAEGQLDSVSAIQHAIVAAMKLGASFGTSHKEGGTNIYWKSGRFVRSDYGDYPAEEQFTNEVEFFKILRRFCEFEISRHARNDQHSDFDSWKLIWRRLQK